MPLKTYENYIDSGPYGTSAHLKVGETGLSHSVPRYYSNNKYSGHGSASHDLVWLYQTVAEAHRNDSNWYIINFTTPYDRFLFEERMRSKLEGRLGASASLGSAIFAEGTESVRMAVNSLERFAGMARAIRKKDLSRLRKAMRKSRTPTQALKKAGGGWLELSFGWMPMVNDIFSAMEATAADFPPTEIKASWTRDYPCTRFEKFGWDSYRWTGTCSQSMKISYEATITNPNVWLMGRLGLLNPLEWVWEAIPFSFFVDYFVNIGDVIHNLSKYAGVSMQHRYTTLVRKHNASLNFVNNYPGEPVKTATGNGVGKTITRYTSPIMSLYTPLQYNVHNPLTSSWQRGLNASSFLAQFFRH